MRDFAFATSRKFVWDAWQHDTGSRKVMAMSFYPKEAVALWSRYSTQAIVHTLNVYSRYTFDFPYPTAISVNGPVRGMEYPMICFNGPRNQEDGTYWASPKEDEARKYAKYPLLTVIIHEVGHNYFPMIVNSDERQWTWLDEGINTFLQFLAEQEWEENYPSRRGEAADIVEYMTSEGQVPIMTDSDSLLQFASNSYAKPGTALNILRETVLGRELFDFAFRQYAQRWKFKRPMPADFFRTLEDASGVDLDWFWHGWFYTNDHVDISLDAVRLYTVDSRDPVIEKSRQKAEEDARPHSVTVERNAEMVHRADVVPELKDFYNTYDPHAVTQKDRDEFDKLLGELEGFEMDLLKTEAKFYVLEFSNKGGLVMPILLDIDYADGTSEESLHLPAEIWRYHPDKVKKLLIRQKEIKSVEIDRQRQTADSDTGNNAWPAKSTPTRFQLFKDKLPPNPMRDAKEAAEKAEAEEAAPLNRRPSRRLGTVNRRALLLGLGAALLLAGPAAAHPYSTSRAEVDWNEKTARFEVSLAVLPEELVQMVGSERKGGEPFRLEATEACDAEIAAYLRKPLRDGLAWRRAGAARMGRQGGRLRGDLALLRAGLRRSRRRSSRG